MDVQQAIERANAILPGEAAPDGAEDARWQAIIAVGEFIGSNPNEVWEFSKRWGSHADEDLRAAIATCLLEHLLEYHFSALFPRVAAEARSSRSFASTLRLCWKFGQSKEPENARAIDRLLRETAS